MWQYNYSNELYHHGILGMKWGKHASSGHVNSARKQKKLTQFKEKITGHATQSNMDASAKRAKDQYEDLKKNGFDTEWFKREYPDEKTAQDLFGESRKQVYDEELAGMKKRAIGSDFTAKNYDKMVNQKVRDIDVSSATKKQIYEVYKKAHNSYIDSLGKIDKELIDN